MVPQPSLGKGGDDLPAGVRTPIIDEHNLMTPACLFEKSRGAADRLSDQRCAIEDRNDHAELKGGRQRGSPRLL